MQTPQFQLRRLKKQLAVERENRDDLEVELAEHRKLLTEKGQSIVGHGEGGDASPGFCGFVMVLAILMLDAACGFGALGLDGANLGFAVLRVGSVVVHVFQRTVAGGSSARHR